MVCLHPAYHATAHLLINNRVCDHQCKDKGLATQILSHTTQLRIGLA